MFLQWSMYGHVHSCVNRYTRYSPIELNRVATVLRWGWGGVNVCLRMEGGGGATLAEEDQLNGIYLANILFCILKVPWQYLEILGTNWTMGLTLLGLVLKISHVVLCPCVQIFMTDLHHITNNRNESGCSKSQPQNLFQVSHCLITTCHSYLFAMGNNRRQEPLFYILQWIYTYIFTVVAVPLSWDTLAGPRACPWSTPVSPVTAPSCTSSCTRTASTTSRVAATGMTGSGWTLTTSSQVWGLHYPINTILAYQSHMRACTHGKALASLAATPVYVSSTSLYGKATEYFSKV